MIIYVPVSLVGSPGWYYILGANIMPTQIATNQGKIQSNIDIERQLCLYMCHPAMTLPPIPHPPSPPPPPERNGTFFCICVYTFIVEH